jgi:RNA polymerase sigma factor (TIGR02999 family)
VNEVYLKLVGSGTEPARSRLQFFALASKAMRNILIDHARGKNRQKRGGDADRIPMHTVLLQAAEGAEPIDAIALDDALSRLAELDERKAKIVELRFFGGLTSEQAADLLGIARSTAADDWRFAKAWLSKELRGSS